MTNKHILFIQLLFIFTFCLENDHKQAFFRGSKSQIVFAKEQTQLLTGILYVRENMIGNIQGDISNIRVQVATNSTDVKQARQQIKQIVDKMRTQLVANLKLVDSIRQISRPVIQRKDKQVYLKVDLVLMVSKSYPIKVRNIVKRVRLLKGYPISIQYSLSQRIQRLYKLKLLRMATFKANSTAKVLSKVMKQKVIGVQNIYFNSYTRTAAVIPIGFDNQLYLTNNKVGYIVNMYANYYIQSIPTTKN